MSFELMGKAPIRFKYTDGAMEANWTFAPDEPGLLEKIQKMADFVRRQADDHGQVIHYDRLADQPYKPKTLEPPSVPNGWELLDQEVQDGA